MSGSDNECDAQWFDRACLVRQAAASLCATYAMGAKASMLIMSEAGPSGPSSPSLAPRKRARTVATPRIVHGSCVEKMKAVKDSSVRLVLADPPYEIGVKGAMWDCVEDYMLFSRAWLGEATRVLQPGGTLLYFASPCTIWSSRINVMLKDEFGMKHQQSLTWVYGQGTLLNLILFFHSVWSCPLRNCLDVCAGGDARLESMKQYAVRNEIIEWWTKTPGVHTFNPELATDRYSDAEKQVALAKGVGRVSEASLNKGRPPRTWVDIPRENSRSKERSYSDVKHPSMKPLMLCERLIAVHSNPYDRVIIPFAGSGSEVLTAARLGREVVGFETEGDYIKLMTARFQSHGVAVDMK